MVDNEALRPLERRILRLVHDGVDDAEIARRFRHSPEFVKRVVEYTGFVRRGGLEGGDVLRPVERRILKWRASGADHTEIGPRFRRSPGHTERIEQLARYKLQAS
jgi:hypothetical protein